MTLSELISRLTKLFPHLTLDDAEQSVNIILKSISKTLAEGSRVEVRGFGVFNILSRSERKARNPKTGETVYVPPKHVPHFKPSKELHKRINFEPMQLIPKNPGGRPPTQGVRPGWMLPRDTIALEAFTKAREAGEKYEFALDAAVKAVKEYDPEIKVSRSMVKKILKELMPENAEEMLRVTKIVEQTTPASESPSPKISYALGFVPKATYPHPSKKIKSRSIKGKVF